MPASHEFFPEELAYLEYFLVSNKNNKDNKKL